MWPPRPPSPLLKYLFLQVAKLREKSLLGGHSKISKTEVCKTEVWPDPIQHAPKQQRRRHSEKSPSKSSVFGESTSVSALVMPGALACDLADLLQNRETGKSRKWLGRVLGRVLGEIRGAGGSAGKGATRGFPFKRNKEQHPCQHSLQHPEFPQHSSQHPPQPFSGFPRFSIL